MSGLAYKKESLNKKSDSMVRVLRGGNIGDENYSFKNDDVFISAEFVKPELYLRKNYMITPAVSSLEHIGKIALIDQNYNNTVVGGFVLMLLPLFNDDVVSRYLLYAFAAKHHRDNCRNITHKSGQAFYNLSRELLMNLPVPIPPKNEMRRIVDRLESLLPHILSYGLIEGKLSELNDTFPEQLKKSILQLAVQGKLVPQDPSDEPAAVLLEKIHTEKERLIKEGKIKRDKNESVIFRRDNSHYEKLCNVEQCIEEEIPFEIPDSWCWCRLGEIFQHNTGKALNSSNQSGELLEYITTSNLYWNRFELGKLRSMYFTDAEIDKCTVETGDLLVCEGGDIGRAAIWNYGYDMRIQNHIHRLRPYVEICIKYFYYLFYFYKKTGMIGGKGIGIQGLSSNALHQILFPVPPAEEQYRIVEAVERLFPYCDRL
ncbi:MAG: restriction endonuclease subunit S [Erysipelotrichaceae bacterium]|nr:restriction endonuclease subunit S [Erysipelotrichaceae bacterium]